MAGSQDKTIPPLLWALRGAANEHHAAVQRLDETTTQRGDWITQARDAGHTWAEIAEAAEMTPEGTRIAASRHRERQALRS